MLITESPARLLLLHLKNVPTLLNNRGERDMPTEPSMPTTLLLRSALRWGAIQRREACGGGAGGATAGLAAKERDFLVQLDDTGEGDGSAARDMPHGPQWASERAIKHPSAALLCPWPPACLTPMVLCLRLLMGMLGHSESSLSIQRPSAYCCPRLSLSCPRAQSLPTRGRGSAEAAEAEVADVREQVCDLMLFL